jgi:hypothetical protein
MDCENNGKFLLSLSRPLQGFDLRDDRKLKEHFPPMMHPLQKDDDMDVMPFRASRLTHGSKALGVLCITYLLRGH